MTLRADNRFVEDEGRHEAVEYYANSLRTRNGQKVLFSNLVSGITRLSSSNIPLPDEHKKRATYACSNLGEAFCPDEIADRTVCIEEDVGYVINTTITNKPI